MSLHFSIVIPSYSPRAPLADCLRSIKSQAYPHDLYEVILVNNQGRRHCEEFLETTLAEVGVSARVVGHGANLGYAGGCNLGAEEALGRFFVFLNDDALLDPAWLGLVQGVFESTPDLGVLSGRVASVSPPMVQGEGSQLVYRNGNFWQPGHGETDTSWCPEQGLVRNLDFFSGEVWVTPRQVWKEVGGLSTAYRPGYYEDSEFGLRCRQLGYRIQILLAATHGHYGSMTSGGNGFRYWRTFHRSRYTFLMRNLLPYRWMEILKAEAAWWLKTRAGQHPGPALAGLLAAFWKTPGALWNRRNWLRRLQQASVFEPPSS